MNSQPQQTGRLERLLRQITLLATLAIKLGGLYLILKAAAEPPVDPLFLGECAFMMSGAQLTESTVLRMIDRFIGRPQPPEDGK